MTMISGTDLKLCSTVTLWPKWQVVIPKEVRDIMNLKQGDTLVLFLKNEKFIWLLRGNDLKELMRFIENQLKSLKKIK
jgi:AbrB family looped-hinge helix DNA binding protein